VFSKCSDENPGYVKCIIHASEWPNKCNSPWICSVLIALGQAIVKVLVTTILMNPW